MTTQLSTETKTSSIGNLWSDPQAFDTAVKMSRALSMSTIVPKEYQGERGLGNCMIALEMANRLKTSPLMVMQNLYVVNGRPAWSSQYIIAMINNSKKYKTEIQFKIEGKGADMSCTAFVVDHDDRTIEGPRITMEMAEKEGWVSKNGSKWKTMPEVMIRYRAASFFGRLNCPDMIMGMYSVDEVLEGDFEEIPRQDVTPEERLKENLENNANKSLVDFDDEDSAEDPQPAESEELSIGKENAGDQTELFETTQEQEDEGPDF